MKDRNKLCKFYIRAGVCSKGKGCTAFGEMQHCGNYIKNSKSKILRADRRKSKMEKIRRKEKWD